MAKRWYAFKLDKNLAGNYCIPAGSDIIIKINGNLSCWNAMVAATETFRAKAKSTEWHGYVLAYLESPAHIAKTCNVVGNLELNAEDALKLINEGAYK